MLLGDASPLSFRWALPLILLLLVLYMTLGDAILFWIALRLRSATRAQAIFWFPGLWVLAEWLRAAGDLGFPWLRLATTQLAYLPMIQIAELLGELGVSLFVVWVNVLLALTWFSFRSELPSIGRSVLSRWWAPTTLLLLLTGQALFGMRALSQLEAPRAEPRELCLAVIQANVDLNDKWDPAKRDSTYVPYTTMTQRAARDGARLVVWGETAVPNDIPRNPAVLEQLRQLAGSSDVAIFTGFPERVVREDGRLDAYNSSALLDDQGMRAERYRKRHLLAFGERLPFQSLIPGIGKIDLGQAEWAVGQEQTVFDFDGIRFGALICFESIFADQAREAVRQGAEFLVNISNDGWFGDTVLPHQHASMAILRAVENRVPLVRCANNGISFWVEPSGRVRQRTGLFRRESFTTCLRPGPGASFYTRHGDVPLFVLVGLGFGFLLLIRGLEGRRG
jgi:apolipoprotein N-acyltransferase